MDRKQIVLELYTGLQQGRELQKSDPSRPREQAVRAAKAEFLSAVRRLDYFVPDLEVLGAETMFPVLVIAGPPDQVDRFSDRVMEDLPNLVRHIEDDLHFAVLSAL